VTERTRDTACDGFRELIHRTLDGDLIESEPSRILHAHLADCEACREVESELRLIQHALRGLPNLPMPDDAFEEVLDRTSRSRSGWRRALDWRAAAAAAIVALGLWSLWALRPPSSTEPSRAELEAAAAQVRMVLGLTHDALDRSRETCINELLRGQVSPALQRLPIRLPGRTPAGDADRVDEEPEIDPDPNRKVPETEMGQRKSKT